MAMKNDYQDYMAKRTDKFSSRMGGVWEEQTRRYVKPFQIFGNLYYVGDEWVCVHLIDTGNGLLLIDTGNCGATAMLVHAIWSLGFNPADVKWIVLSHAHVDHIGGVNFFKNMFGSKVFLGEADALMLAHNPELSLIQESTDYADSLFVPDEVIRDGDTINFGGTDLYFRLVPGHTAGTIAAFFNVTNGTTTLRAGTFGGFGFNTLQKDYLVEIGDKEYAMRQRMLESLDKVKEEPVDIFVANHTINNSLLERAERLDKMQNGNPFVDSSLWRSYIEEKRTALIELMENPDNS